MEFPIVRGRRLRKNNIIRRMVKENRVHLDDLVYPLFVAEGEGIKREILSMPGIYNMSIEHIVTECIELEKLGLSAVILFGVPLEKDEEGSGAYSDEGIIQQAIRAIKESTDLYVITDVCLCEYTSHGHCGLIIDGDVDNDSTLELLQKEAVSHAKAGADMIAPSDMMDGRVMAIRDALDGNGFSDIPIMSYAVKYASAYYGPFRDAANSTPSFGDRRSYQMDYSNRNEAVREATQDIREGADIIMVKPALAYMDIIRDMRNKFDVPIACYNVSGEYSMIKAAAERGFIDEKKVVMETLTGFKRAGADIIITYFAKQFAKDFAE